MREGRERRDEGKGRRGGMREGRELMTYIQ